MSLIRIKTKWGWFIADFSVDKKTGIRRHDYTLAGVPLLGTTTPLKRIDKGERLKQWIANQTAEAMRRKRRNPTSAWRRARDKAGASGRGVHTHIARWAKTGNIPKRIDRAKRASFNEFRSWFKHEKVVVLYVETPVFSKTHGYAGTIDMIVIWRGKIWILDIKTSSEIYDDHWYQMDGYEQCVTELDLFNNPAWDFLRLRPIPARVDRRVHGHIVVNLPKRGGIRVKHTDLRSVPTSKLSLRKFMAALELSR